MNRFVQITRLWVLMLLLGVYGTTLYAASDNSKTGAKKIVPNKVCIKCHSDEENKFETLYEDEDDEEGTEVYIYVDEEKFEESVHGKQNCVGCHTNITKKYHQEQPVISVSCIQCHKEEWEKQQGEEHPRYDRLDVVMQQIDGYMDSVHARPSIADQSRTNATCHDCHDPHNIGTLGSEARADHRLKNPEVCGRCHEEQKEAYLTSAHGREVVENGNSEAAVCSDCHTTHNIDSPDRDPIKLTITQNCGDCHEDAYKTYRSSYHGQVNRLGYTNTAKCYDCHGSHELKKVEDPTSSVHLENRLETCQQCHEDAPEGFLSFHAHANVDDYERYPEIYLTAKFMNYLIIAVFAFFWTHVLLWFHREYKDRKQGKGYQPPPAALLAAKERIYFRRFSATWRVIHLLFAVSTMTLVLTGSSLLFSHTAWAPVVIGLLGGPEIEAIIHRTAATTWLSVFLVHFGIASYNIIKNRKSFRWFGPTSMLPNWQDLRDVVAMFRWFFGRAERPDFDRWSYWQKFDYWAPFWGAGVIGLSGMMLFSPTLAATVLPGYVFNIATIIHAEEALLATMFLFTVHFFNAHFRPDKFPMSTTIFTGAIPLDEFKHEHRLEYERLKESGELSRYLIKKPSKAMQTGSNLLGAILIFSGLTLLTLVMIGYISTM